MSVWEGILQGIIQGITEFLPVSSSGHLALFQHFFGLSNEESLFFSLMLHLGTLAAVIAAFYEDIWAMLVEVGKIFKELFAGQFSIKTKNPQRNMLYMLVLATLPLVLVLPLKGLVAKVSADGDIVVEGFCFLFTSLLLFGACKCKVGKAGPLKMKPKHALTIGVMQGIATMPGISRSGSTISTGLILGFDREFMVKFSFLLGIPAILGASVLDIGDAIKQDKKIDFVPLFAGMLTAAVVGYLSIQLIRWLLLSNKFIIFAWYTLALGIVVIVVGLVQHFIGKGGADSATAASSLSNAGSAVSQAASALAAQLALLR